jgi:hypothetical protein
MQLAERLWIRAREVYRTRRTRWFPYAITRRVAERVDIVDGVYLICTKRGLYCIADHALLYLRPGHYYGATCHGGQVYVFEVVGSRGRVLGFPMAGDGVPHGKPQVVVEGLSPGCHQIDFHDGHLFVMDSYLNAIRKYDAGRWTHTAYYPRGRLTNGRRSENYAHMNSIVSHRGHYYVVCHNETKKTGRNSQVLRLTRSCEVDEVLDTSAGNAHNVLFCEAGMLLCDSLNFRLLCDDRVVFEAQHFTRGLSYSAEGVLVGGSDHEPDRAKRTQSGGMVYVLDKAFRERGRIPVPGMVQEIRRLDAPDYSLSLVNDAAPPLSRPAFQAPSGNVSV